MNTYRELADRIQGELTDLDTTIQKAIRSWNLAQKLGDSQDVYLDSVALNLHGFYSALERLFELIVRHIDKQCQRVRRGTETSWIRLPLTWLALGRL